jgi:orotate phosphoribosyltransferase
MSDPDLHAELVRLLKDKSYRRQRVILASGRESDFYVDGRQTTLHARGATIIGRLILRRLLADDHPVQAVGGLTLGADPIATAVSVISEIEGHPIHAFLVRKETKSHGTGNKIEGLANVPAGTSVCLVEDTSTTGGSVLKAIRAAEQADLVVRRVITIVDRQEGAVENLAEAGYALEALVTRAELEND